ncbi:hypothetical protein BBAD15_g11234 [Beauveria bassiana D1-5]|uniref:Rhodanese domain-containing protein n=1 Tax=Beauveria bassiana D1-5 TaxID=1245745 RepID=A0A0A2VRV9_BEABA|nr:hypothetical protein BBAD15_g11234 [Beauveria bassiana D1-5]
MRVWTRRPHEQAHGACRLYMLATAAVQFMRDAAAVLQTRKDTLVVCYDGDSARVAASVMRAKGYAANSLRGGLVGLVTMLSTPQTCAKAGPEQQTSWLQLCEAQRAPAATVEAPAAKSSSELLKLQQAAVTVKYWSIE